MDDTVYTYSAFTGRSTSDQAGLIVVIAVGMAGYMLSKLFVASPFTVLAGGLTAAVAFFALKVLAKADPDLTRLIIRPTQTGTPTGYAGNVYQ